MSIIYGNTRPEFLEIYPKWSSIDSTVIRAGTPLDASGAIANDETAIGIVAEDTGETDNPISIIIAGVLDLAAIEASYGELSGNCIAALRRIVFVGSDGAPIVPSGGGLPDYSEASDGDVLSIDNGAPAWSAPSGGGDSAICLLTIGVGGNLLAPSAGGIETTSMVFIYEDYGESGEWQRYYDAYYVYDGDIADIISKFPLLQEQVEQEFYTINYVYSKVTDTSTAQAAPHDGGADDALFVTSETKYAILGLENGEDICIIPSTATIEAGHVQGPQ